MFSFSVLYSKSHIAVRKRKGSRVPEREREGRRGVSRLGFYLVGHAESPMSFEQENESTFGNQITMVWKMD